MSAGFYIKRKYPSTSRKLSKFFFACLIIYILIYSVFLGTSKKEIRFADLKALYGSVEYFEVPSSNNKLNATLKLKDNPRLFSFDMRGYSGSTHIENGDSVKILVSTTALKRNATSISSYELKKDDTFIFSLDKYNSELLDDSALARIFLWIAICFLVLYILYEIAGFRKWVEMQLSSSEKNFRSTKPNFNEFLDS